MKKILTKELLMQAISFFVISGIGWLVDMLIYSLLTHFVLNPTLANIISSSISVTYVYIVSTNKLFVNISDNLDLKKKFVIYILYQIAMIICSSIVIGMLSSSLFNIPISFVSKYCKLFAKICNTPVTMICNFVFMKILIEKIK